MADIAEKTHGLVLGGTYNTAPGAISIVPQTCTFDNKLDDFDFEKVISDDASIIASATKFTLSRKFKNTSNKTMYINHAGIIGYYGDPPMVPEGFLLLLDLPVRSSSNNYITLFNNDIINIKLNFVYPVGTMEYQY
jgi:hypothetical protein